MKKYFLAICLVMFTFPAFAESAGLVLDVPSSSIKFLAKSTLHDIHGKAGTFSGKLVLSKDSPSATGEVEVPVLSLFAMNTAMDRNMYAMFESATFPQISFDIKSVDLSQAREGAETRVIVLGVFAMHGVSREVSIPLVVRLDRGRYVCQGSFSLSLKEFKLKAPRILFIKVADQVEVELSVVFMPP